MPLKKSDFFYPTGRVHQQDELHVSHLLFPGFRKSASFLSAMTKSVGKLDSLQSSFGLSSRRWMAVIFKA